MATFKDLIPTIDFKLEPAHTVEFNPNAELRELESSGRKYPAVVVIENGRRMMLPVGSNRLANKLHEFDNVKTAVKLKITRLTPESGNSFDTDYNVEEIKGKDKVA